MKTQQQQLSERALALKREPVVPRLFSIRETAVDLGISVGMLYREIGAGEIETTRIGDRQLTTIEQREAFIARKQQRVRQPALRRRRLVAAGR